MLLGSHTYELCFPQRDTTIVGNLIHDNNQPDTAAVGLARLGMRNGILVAGGVRNTILRNRVLDHERVGIALVPPSTTGPSVTPGVYGSAPDRSPAPMRTSGTPGIKRR